jgi:hypothetical protein
VSKLKRAIQKLIDRLANPHLDYLRRSAGLSTVDKGTQILLTLKYRDILHSGQPLPPLHTTGFRVFSQYDEDGILLYLFALLGTPCRTAVEICAGDGIECNAANLIINHGWHALLFDANPENIARGRRFYARCRDTALTPPTFVPAWVEPDNINALLEANGYSGEIDLLTLDLDGMDYWVWQAITSLRPRVVVTEYQGGWEADRSLTLPYRPQFSSWALSQGRWGIEGASLLALTKLGAQKGYRLVGGNRNDTNAFFVRNDLGADFLPEVSVASCLQTPRSTDPKRRAALQQIEWTEV